MSGTLDRLREHLSKAGAPDSAVVPWTEAQREALLRVLPGRAFRLRLQQDGSVLINGDCIRSEVRADGRGDADEPVDRVGAFCQELARLTREMLNDFQMSEDVQILRAQIDDEGRTARYEVRVTHSAPGEAVAFVRDVGTGGEWEDGACGSQGEATTWDKVLRKQVSEYAGDEEVIRDVSSKLNSLLEDTIKAIQSVVQRKDPATARHQARVWKLACAIGREMGLGKTRVAIIGLAALVHDFGKVFISPDILNKPGRLTDAEFAAVKNHADAVFEVLGTIDLFCPIADIVHQHHERMNGSGYPLGLKGDEILLEARIIAVADVVEAMLSDRPHRAALGIEAAMKEIARGRGTLYDADAVDACIRLFNAGKFEFDPELEPAGQAARSQA